MKYKKNVNQMFNTGANFAKVLETSNRASDIIFDRGAEQGGNDLAWITANIIEHPAVESTRDAVERIRSAYGAVGLEEAIVLAIVAKYGLEAVQNAMKEE